jgi:cysteinylglycine-S-conjugate dipeptidase
VTVLGIDAPAVAGSTASVQASVGARVTLRVPPEMSAEEARRALEAHLHAHVPWGLRLDIETGLIGDGFWSRTDGPAFAAMQEAMRDAFDREPVTAGVGGGIPLCAALQRTFPDAEILLFGVGDPASLLHAPKESIDPGELERTAIAEADFLQRYARGAAR